MDEQRKTYVLLHFKLPLIFLTSVGQTSCAKLYDHPCMQQKRQRTYRKQLTTITTPSMQPKLSNTKNLKPSRSNPKKPLWPPPPPAHSHPPLPLAASSSSRPLPPPPPSSPEQRPSAVLVRSGHGSGGSAFLRGGCTTTTAKTTTTTAPHDGIAATAASGIAGRRRVGSAPRGRRGKREGAHVATERREHGDAAERVRRSAVGVVWTGWLARRGGRSGGRENFGGRSSGLSVTVGP